MVDRKSTLGSAIKSVFAPQTTTVRAVDHLNFGVNEGEAVGFIGQNGAGKTTTIKMLTGTLYPTSGYCWVNGFDPVKRQNDFKRSISVVMGNRSQLFNDLTPRDYLNFLQAVYDRNLAEFNEIVDQIAQTLKVEDKLNLQTRKLSLGERMKIEFLAAVSIKPRVLFLDEPTIGLDVLAKRDIRSFLVKLNKEKGLTIFLTSHDMEDIATICDRLIIVNQGKLIWDGQTQDLIKKFQQNKYITFNKAASFRAFKLNEDIVSQDEIKITIRVPASQVDQKLSELIDVKAGTDYSIQDLKLDDIIFELFSKGE
ncbi:ABC transporter ATP-binding protein [Lactobacillus xylocopicola]|uniref:Multidrug ABC transporter ATP-binding protein n=1 Tax=Lactobacillus xylocopicola TaxID=2976676 RepID=A0ABN6SJ34_9LACO|nr:ATP-binding cassette domain-containing protein [Lactobacillus xylocopicola]BDR60353.1 multidrug ABC transporter ATP-binding protein [Lactobacillus xylocopicola]